MAKVCLIGIDDSTALHICRVLAIEGHQVTDHLVHGDDVPLPRIDLIFAGGDPRHYLPLLAEVRRVRPEMPFVVIAQKAATSNWLDAFDAGVTDYCVMPLEARHLQWTIESIALSHGQRASAFLGSRPRTRRAHASYATR